MVALTKSIARFAGPHGITANCVNPGVIDTPMIAAWPPEVRERDGRGHAAGPHGHAGGGGGGRAWLASDGAAFVHGAHVDVNGGLYMD